MEHHSAVLLRRRNPYSARLLAGVTSLRQPRVYTETPLEHWRLTLLEQGEGIGEHNVDSLLNPQRLPVMAQPWFGHMTAKQRPSFRQRTRNEKQGIVLTYNGQAEGEWL